MIIRRLSILLLAICATAVAAMAQLTSAEAFASAPATVFPLLDPNTRLDMIDYFRSGMSTSSANALKGKSSITAMTDEDLVIRMTDSSTAHLIVLPVSSTSPVIGLISTVATPGLDSHINFYDAAWTAIDGSKYFIAPSLDVWLTKDGQANRDMVEMQVPFLLVSYDYSPATKQLTLTNNLDKFLDEDIYAIVSPYLRKSLTYTWNGKKFNLDK